MRQGALGIVVCACALLLAAAAPASAAPSRVATTSNLRAGPALASDGTAWADASRRGYVVRSSLPGRGVTTLLRRPLERDDEPEDNTSVDQFLTLVGSDRRLAFSDDVFGGDQYHSERSVVRFTGPPAGPLGSLPSCSASLGTGQPGSLSSGAVAVSGDTVAYVDCQDRTVVRDLRPGGASRTFPVPSAAGELALSGQYVAEFVSGAGGDRIRVSNWVTGALAYVADAADGFDLGPDGTLAAVRIDGAGCTGRLELHSRAQPAPRRLSLVPCTPAVSLAGGRVAVVAAAARRQRALALTGADNARRDVALLGRRGVQAGLPSGAFVRNGKPGLDFDGGRAAYALKRCDGRQDLLTVPVADPGRLRAVSARCPVSILTRRAGLTRRNRLVFRLRCSRGCAGRIFLRIGRRNGRAARVTARPARRSRRIAFRATGTLPASLRAGRVIRATLVARTRERNGRLRVTRKRVRLSG